MEGRGEWDGKLNVPGPVLSGNWADAGNPIYSLSK